VNRPGFGRALDHLLDPTAIGQLREQVPGAKLRLEDLDLSSLASVAAIGERLVGQGHPYDILINNAGIMAPPKRRYHRRRLRAPVRQQLPRPLRPHRPPAALLRAATEARVTTMSSGTAWFDKIDFDDLAAPECQHVADHVSFGEPSPQPSSSGRRRWQCSPRFGGSGGPHES